jgi:hypothetical protein
LLLRTGISLTVFLCFSDPKIVLNFSDPNGGVGSVLDSLKMSQQQLTPEQELKHQQQARKGIQTSPDGKISIISPPSNYVSVGNSSGKSHKIVLFKNRENSFFSILNMVIGHINSVAQNHHCV